MEINASCDVYVCKIEWVAKKCLKLENYWKIRISLIIQDI